MFMHMLGHPTHFGQMETLKLIASAGYAEKRIGYLGLTLLLDERQEVLMLVTNSLKNDLNSGSQHVVGLALTALGTICSAEMARDLAPEVARLLGSGNPYVRKKAALAAVRVLRKAPDLLEELGGRAAELLHDRNHGVLLAGATLVLDVCEREPAAAEAFRGEVPQLCRVLRALLVGGYSAEYDVGGVCDPYLQVKALRLLRALGAGSAEASDAMSDVLAQVAANTEGARPAGNAVLYECVRTIMGVEAIGGLRVLAVNTLGRFLAHRDNNIRYVALDALARVVAVDAAAVARHRATVVACVRDGDASIRRKALELVFALVDAGNAVALVGELLDFLRVAEPDFRADLADRACRLARKFAPDGRWYVDATARALREAGDVVTEDAVRALLVAVVNAPRLHGYAARALVAALREGREGAAAPLVVAGVWAAGEYGELVVSGGGRLEGEALIATTPEELIALVGGVLEDRELPPHCAEYALTALAKLAARFPAAAGDAAARIAAHARDPALEAQSRAVEYGRLFTHEAIRPAVMEHVPPLEGAAFDAALDGGEAAAPADAAAAAAADLAALLGLDVGAAAPAAAAAAPPSAPAPAAPAAASPVASPRAAPGAPAATITAFSNEDVLVTFALHRVAGAPGALDLRATATNRTAELLAAFALQAAVPRSMQLRLEPASAGALAPAGGPPLTQLLHVVNPAPGARPLAMRLRVAYTRRGEAVTHQAEVSGFPPDV
jgi:AP-1 complex subunit gamma-1